MMNAIFIRHNIILMFNFKVQVLIMLYLKILNIH